VPKYEGVRVRLVDLVQSLTPPIIEGSEFENCRIEGPAVLAILENTRIVHCEFDGDMDSLLWELPLSRKMIVGAIGVRNCSFTDCKFFGIGFAGPAEFVVAFRKGTADAGQATPAAGVPAPAPPQQAR
jgi:hypothetical protein